MMTKQDIYTEFFGGFLFSLLFGTSVGILAGMGW